MNDPILKTTTDTWKEYKYYLEERESKKKDQLKVKFRSYLSLSELISAMLYQRFSVKKVNLIGSLLDFDWFHDRSDIDIVADGLESKDYFKAWLEIEKITDGEPFHLLDMKDISDDFRRKVLTKGKLL